MWDTFVEMIRLSVFAAAQVCNGSLGSGVSVVSLTLRLTLLPFTLRLAVRARAQQARMAALAPELERLRELYRNDPARYWREASSLMRRHGIRLGDPSAILGLMVQAPILFGLFAAVRKGLGDGVRFLWITDLARPDVRLALVVTALTGLSIATTPGSTLNQGPVLVALVAGTLGTALFPMDDRKRSGLVLGSRFSRLNAAKLFGGLCDATTEGHGLITD
jgi:YidC/Oxa1 family membrane protein insertase